MPRVAKPAPPQRNLTLGPPHGAPRTVPRCLGPSGLLLSRRRKGRTRQSAKPRSSVPARTRALPPSPKPPASSASASSIHQLPSARAPLSTDHGRASTSHGRSARVGASAGDAGLFLKVRRDIPLHRQPTPDIPAVWVPVSPLLYLSPLLLLIRCSDNPPRLLLDWPRRPCSICSSTIA